jgi:hypothetical protein
MSYLNIEMNEDNYDYEDLLNLLTLKPDFDHTDLKNAKRKVMKLHPDRSKLPREVFVFMIKMYCKVEEIYNFTYHETDKDKLTIKYDVDEKFKNYLEQNDIDPVNNYKLFTKEFNKMFDQVYISENKDGYTDWLKSEDGIYNKDDLEESRQTAIQNSIIKVDDEITEVGGADFSNQPTDLKEVYTNPFLAMDIEKVYREKQKFSSIQEYKSFLATEDNKNGPLSNEGSLQYFEHKEQLLNNQSKNLAFEQMKQKEIMNQNYNNYISKYLNLEN